MTFDGESPDASAFGSQDAESFAEYTRCRLAFAEITSLLEILTMTRRILSVVVSLVLLVHVGRLLAADELLKRVPAGANALMVIDVTALEATPLSQAQG